MGPVNLEDLVARLDRLDKENQSLRAGKERLELAQQETGIGFYDWDLINGSADLSEEWLKIYGRPADMAQITFEDWLKFLHPSDRDRAGENAIKSVMAGVRYEDEFRIVWPDESVHWVRNGGKAVFDAQGRVSRFIGTVIDITERKAAETNLSIAHQRLDALMRAVPVGVSFSDDISCERISGNPAVLTQFECSPDDNLSASSSDERVAGRQFRIFKDGREIRGDELPLQRAVATNQEIPPVELEFLLPSGKRWFAETSGAPIRDARGILIGGLAVTLDLTRRKQAERALAESQKQNEFLAKLIRDSSQPVAVAYENGAIGLVNRAFEELTGYSSEELRALGRPRLTPPEYYDHERAKLDEMRRTGHPVRYEKEYLRKDGTRVPVELLVHMVPATSEEAEYYYTFTSDITERKQSREQLEEKVAARTAELLEANQQLAAEIAERARNERELQRMNRGWRMRSALLKAVNVCTDELDLVQRVCDATVVEGGFPVAWVGFAGSEPLHEVHFVACSGNTSAVVGDESPPWAAGGVGLELARKSIRTGEAAVLAAPADEPGSPGNWAMTSEIGSMVALPLIAESVTLGVIVICCDRSEASSDLTVSMLQQAANGLAQGVAMLRAKSGRLEAESKLKQTESELARVARSLTLGELTASIAHEINQPLAAVVANANACVRWLNAESPNLDEAKVAARRIGRDANRAADVITRIRALLAKGDSIRQELALNDVVQEIIPLIEAELRRRDAKLVLTLQKNLSPVLIDKVQIQQLLMNLLMNALDAMAHIDDRQRVVRIITASQGSSVLISVQDTGKGLDAEQMGKLFDAFYTTKPHGLGIGLSISRSIAESHGGRLWATSEPGAGATFHFMLPAAVGDLV